MRSSFVFFCLRGIRKAAYSQPPQSSDPLRWPVRGGISRIEYSSVFTLSSPYLTYTNVSAYNGAMRTTISIPDDLWETAKCIGIRDRKTLNQVIEDAMRIYVDDAIEYLMDQPGLEPKLPKLVERK